MLFANVTDRKLMVCDLQKLNSSSTGMEGGITDLSAELVLILRHLADQLIDSSNGKPLFKTKEEVKNYFLELVDLAVDADFSDPFSAILSNADAPKEKKFALCKSLLPLLPSPLDIITPMILQNKDGEFDMDETVRFFDEVLVSACKDTQDLHNLTQDLHNLFKKKKED